MIFHYCVCLNKSRAVPIPKDVIQGDVEAVFLDKGSGEIFHVTKDVHEEDVSVWNVRHDACFGQGVVAVGQAVDLLVEEVDLVPVGAALFVAAVVGNFRLDPQLVLGQVRGQFLAHWRHLAVAVALDRVDPVVVQDWGGGEPFQVSCCVSLKHAVIFL